MNVWKGNMESPIITVPVLFLSSEGHIPHVFVCWYLFVTSNVDGFIRKTWLLMAHSLQFSCTQCCHCCWCAIYILITFNNYHTLPLRSSFMHTASWVSTCSTMVAEDIPGCTMLPRSSATCYHCCCCYCACCILCLVQICCVIRPVAHTGLPFIHGFGFGVPHLRFTGKADDRATTSSARSRWSHLSGAAHWECPPMSGARMRAW